MPNRLPTWCTYTRNGFLLLCTCLWEAEPESLSLPKHFVPLRTEFLSLCVKLNRAKDYTAPVNFISAGLRKTAAEEKKEQLGSDDSDEDEEAPPPPRATAPRKLQTVG